MELVAEFVVPVVTVSVLNSREHWGIRATRTKKHRIAAMNSMLANRISRSLCEAAGVKIVVTLTRLSSRLLDEGDNLPASMKAIRDGIAQWWDIDDRNPVVKWEYGQGRGTPGVKVRIERAVQE